MIFILRHGYKQSRYLNLDCLIGNLLDSAKQDIIQESLRALKEAEKRWLSISNELEEKVSNIFAKFGAKKEAENRDLFDKNHQLKQNFASKNESKKELNRENDQANLKNQAEALERQIAIYKEKLSRIARKITELEILQKEDELKMFDFVDLTGERLFINRRLDQRAKGIVVPSKPYYLVRIDTLENPSSAFRPIALEGFLLQAPEEEGGNERELNLFSLKKTAKGK